MGMEGRAVMLRRKAEHIKDDAIGPIEFFSLLVILIFLLTACGGKPLPATEGPVTEEPTEVPQIAPTSAVLSLDEQLAQIDAALQQTLSASIAYNKPQSMNLGKTETIELLLNPSLSPEILSTQVTEPGQVASTSIQITPRMKALLVANSSTAFEIQPIHDNPEQIVSSVDTTRWSWLVTAKEGGTQQLTLVIYRLVKYEGQDYWREVETYRADIDVTVTFAQRIQALDWKWIAGFLLTFVGSVLGILNWLNNRKKDLKEEKSREDKSVKNEKKRRR